MRPANCPPKEPSAVPASPPFRIMNQSSVSWEFSTNALGAIAQSLVRFAGSDDDVANQQPHRNRLAQREHDLDGATDHEIFREQHFPETGGDCRDRRPDRKTLRRRSTPPACCRLLCHAKAIKHSRA